MNGSTEVATSVASAATDWKWSVSDLPMYDKGVEIKYTITEDGVAGYETTYRDWDVINSYTPETIDIHGVKTWNMGAYPNAKKPEGVIINLYADGELVDYTVASAKGGWEWSFTDMPKNSAGEPIEYTVAEEPILDFASTVTGSVEEGFTVTNTYAPRTGSLYIYKEEVFWLNGRQVSESPDGRGGEWYDISVTIDGWTEQVRIQGGGEPVVYHNLPYGTTYSVEEIIPEGALFSSDIYDRGYGYIDARSTGVDVVNTYHYDVENAAFTAVKVDSETLQPVAGAGFTLYADAACTSVLANTVSDAQGNIVLPISGAGTYYLVETTTPAGYYANETVYTIVAESSFVVAEGNVITRKLTVTAEGLTSENGAYVIKNTAIKPADVSVQKVWNDNGYTIDRPESIDVTLLRDGAPYETVKLNSANGWFYSWDGLTDEYTWTVDEVNVPADYAKTVANNGDMWTITNTRETVTVSGVKTWDLAGYENVVIPESVTIRLLANGIEIASTTANAEGNWAWSFGVLPATVNGAKIVYTVSEDAVEDFISAVTGDAATGYVVTNTYSPKLGGLTISKQVKGSGADKDEAFTFTLTLTGMTGEVAYTGAANGTFNAAEALTFTLAHGQSITVTGILAGTQYTVVETAHEDYSSEAINAAGTVAEGEAAKVDFVNTYIAEDEDEVIVDIPKTGDDSNRMALPVLIALAIMWLGVGYYVIKRKLFA